MLLTVWIEGIWEEWNENKYCILSFPYLKDAYQNIEIWNLKFENLTFKLYIFFNLYEFYVFYW